MKERTITTTNQMTRDSVSLETKPNQMTYLSTLLTTNSVSISGSLGPIFVPNAHTNSALIKRMITAKDCLKVNPKVKKENDQHQENRVLTSSSSTVNSFVNAYDILATKDNGDDIGTDAFPEMGSKVTKSTEGTVCTRPVVTCIIGNLIMSVDQASPRDTEG